MQGARISANEHPAALDECLQLCQVELPEIHDAVAIWPQCLTGSRSNPRGGFAIRRARAQNDASRGRASRKRGHNGRKRRLRPASKRIPGADVNDYEFVGRGHASRGQTLGNPSVRGDVAGHFHRVPYRVRTARRPALYRLEQVPLIHDRVPTPQLAGPRHGPRVHPRSSLDLVTDARWRSRQPREPCASRAAVEVDHQVVPLTAQPAGQPQIVGNSTQAGASRRHNHFIQVRVFSNDSERLRFDQIREMRVRKPALQRANERRRENDVAYQAQPNK